MPSKRKGESREGFNARMRDYMNARNHPTVPLPHSVTRPSRPHRELISQAQWDKRNAFIAFDSRGGRRGQLYPERVLGRDSRADATLVAALHEVE